MFCRGIPDLRQSNRKLGENIGYFEKTFIQDFKNMKKIHFWVLGSATGDQTKEHKKIRGHDQGQGVHLH